MHKSESPEGIVHSLVHRQLSDIQETFGLNISELAAVLQVQRPTIYQWQKGTILRAKNAHRLGQIHGIAMAARQLHLSEPARLLHLTPDGHQSLFSLLRAENANEEDIIAAMTRDADLRDRQRDVRTRLSTAALKHGFEDVSPEAQANNIQRNSSEIS